MTSIEKIRTDESLWPDGATHYLVGSNSPWRKWEGSREFLFDDHHDIWRQCITSWSVHKWRSEGKTLISRPSPAAPEWDGDPDAYMCPAGCGCLWRDNHNGTMSLYGPNSESCDVCEPLPLNQLVPVKAVKTQEESEWEGEWPPVGANQNDFVPGYGSSAAAADHPDSKWEVLAHHKGQAVVCFDDFGKGELRVKLVPPSGCLLIKPKAQREREALEYLIKTAYATNGVQGVADAIQSEGYRKGGRE